MASRHYSDLINGKGPECFVPFIHTKSSAFFRKILKLFIKICTNLSDPESCLHIKPLFELDGLLWSLQTACAYCSITAMLLSVCWLL